MSAGGVAERCAQTLRRVGYEGAVRIVEGAAALPVSAIRRSATSQARASELAAAARILRASPLPATL